MTNEQDEQARNLATRRGDVQPPARDIIDIALRQGGSEQVVIAAQQEALRLAGKQREADMNGVYARRELGEFLEQAEEAGRLRDVDFDAQADFKRASGVTRITVKRRRRWWWPF